MGTEYNCGCRWSGGAWYLCKKHESDLELDLAGLENTAPTIEIHNNT